MVGLIYTISEGGLVSIFIPDSDAQLDNLVMNDGEAMLKVNNAQYAAAGKPDALQALVNAATGKPSPPSRQCVLNTDGNVIDVIRAYPSTFDLVEGYSMIAHELAAIGDHFVAGQWVPTVIPDPVR